VKPHPCGYATDERHPCTCAPQQIQRYRSRISGPLLDRIDLQIEVPAVPYKDLKAARGSLDSATMRGRILEARRVQAGRYEGLPLLTNSQLSGKWLTEFCPLTETEHAFLEKAVQRLGLSARAYTKILRIARTIADLEHAQALQIEHLAEAINYRSMDRPGEG
jgi:magnesium chelatase family protein